MDEAQKCRLEFKRKFLLDNLERIKKGQDRLMNNSESAKKWVVTIWFGSIALTLKESFLCSEKIFLLLLIVTMFYLIDTYFIALANEYGKRIDPIERWMMTATDEEILNFNSALYEIAPRSNFKDMILLPEKSVKFIV
jgi:hypothetical protein